MLKPFFNFLRREKLYTILFILVLNIYGYAAFLAMNHQKPNENDQASLKQFEKAEDAFQEKVKDPEKLKNYLKENPKSALIFQAASATAFLALMLGCVILYRFLFIPGWKDQWKVEAFGFDPTRWSLGMLIKVILLYLFASFIFTIILGVLKKLFFQNHSDHFVILTHTLLSNLACVFIIIIAVKKRGGSFQNVGLQLPSKSIVKEFWAAWVGYLAVIPVFAVVLAIVSTISSWRGSEPDPHPLVFMFLENAQSNNLIIYSLIIAIFFAPIMEEFFFRGFCYPLFKHRFGSAIAMVLTSSLFAMIHGSLFAFWPIFVLGLVLNYLYEIRQSLIAPIILHVTHNALFISYFFMAKQIILHS